MRRLMMFAASLLLCGCTLAQVNVEVAGERTSLEKQVLGSYNALTQQAMLSSSVRGVDPLGSVETPPEMSADGQAAMDAVQTVAFHADDISAFKRLGWVGEGNDGLLTSFAMAREGAPDDLVDFAASYSVEEFSLVVNEVNQSRTVLMNRVIQTDEDLTDADLPEVQAVFARLNAERSLPGERIQQSDGTWTEK